MVNNNNTNEKKVKQAAQAKRNAQQQAAIDQMIDNAAKDAISLKLNNLLQKIKKTNIVKNSDTLGLKWSKRYYSNTDELLKDIDWHVVSRAAKAALEDCRNPETVSEYREILEQREDADND